MTESEFLEFLREDAEDETIACPECDGSGWGELYLPASRIDPAEYRECAACNGTGVGE